MSKFDGPNFINPLHTSFGQNQGTYQNPVLSQDFIKNKDNLERKIGVPGAGKIKFNLGWNEDESKTNIKSKISQKLNENFNLDQKVEKNNETNNTPLINFEKKIIEDLLVSTTILVKPSESQINEFINKIKNLNKSFIYKILIDKIENCYDKSDQNKILIVKI